MGVIRGTHTSSGVYTKTTSHEKRNGVCGVGGGGGRSNKRD